MLFAGLTGEVVVEMVKVEKMEGKSDLNISESHISEPSEDDEEVITPLDRWAENSQKERWQQAPDEEDSVSLMSARGQPAA